MPIEKKPFRLYNTEWKSADVITVKINPEQRELLEQLKFILQQEKDSTALKQLALIIGAEVVLDKKMKATLQVILNNYRKNKRLGIVRFD